MGHNLTNMYDIDPHLAELYDQNETYTSDIDLICTLIGARRSLRILEPFCGTARILLPLARMGHEMVGLDQAKGMLARARQKAIQLPPEVRSHIYLQEADVIVDPWPSGFDLVILGGNCFYELATAQEQEICIAKAAAALNHGGFVYIDNNHMEGDLDPAWVASPMKAFPVSECQDGTRVEESSQVIWYDIPKRLIRYRRSLAVTFPDGTVVKKEYTQQKHPVSATEIQAWLACHGFTILNIFGDRLGTPYSQLSPRAIFWAFRGYVNPPPTPALAAHTRTRCSTPL